jgi:hypothetical protein
MVLTADELLNLMSDRGVYEAVLPPLSVGNANEHGLYNNKAEFAIVQDAARCMVREEIPEEEPTPEFLGTWKDWGIGRRSVGDVAFGSPQEINNRGTHIAFELEKTRAVRVELSNPPSAEQATLLVGRKVRPTLIAHESLTTHRAVTHVPQAQNRVYALGIDRMATPPVQANLFMTTCPDGLIAVRLYISTVPLWARGARPGEVVEKMIISSPPTVAVDVDTPLGKRKTREFES